MHIALRPILRPHLGSGGKRLLISDVCPHILEEVGGEERVESDKRFTMSALTPVWFCEGFLTLTSFLYPQIPIPTAPKTHFKDENKIFARYKYASH